MVTENTALERGQFSRLPFGAFITIAVLLACFVLLTGCNTGSISEGLRPDAGVASRNQPAPAEAVGNTTAYAPQSDNPGSTPVEQKQQAALQPISPVTFLPVTGAPQSTVTSLAASIRAAAQNERVPIVVSVDQGAKYQIKGYFSALSEGNGTLLVYVWDILDLQGNRVHRISGQERGRGSSGDPWASIDSDMIERVARITMSDLRSWITTRG